MWWDTVLILIGCRSDQISSDMPRATPLSWNARSHALDLALAGERVAVVSGGDAGIFGMASAVFEAAANDRYAESRSRCFPG